MLAIRFAAALVLSAALLFAGCGGDNGNGPTEATPEAAESTPEATPAPEQTETADPEGQADGVPVELDEWDVRVTEDAEAGTITFRARNVGQFAHELTVIRTETDAAELPVEGLRAEPDGEVVGSISNVRPGDEETLEAELEPGHYALICNLPGHYERGMHANYVVE